MQLLLLLLLLFIFFFLEIMALHARQEVNAGLHIASYPILLHVNTARHP